MSIFDFGSIGSGISGVLGGLGGMAGSLPQQDAQLQLVQQQIFNQRQRAQGIVRSERQDFPILEMAKLHDLREEELISTPIQIRTLVCFYLNEEPKAIAWLHQFDRDYGCVGVIIPGDCDPKEHLRYWQRDIPASSIHIKPNSGIFRSEYSDLVRIYAGIPKDVIVIVLQELHLDYEMIGPLSLIWKTKDYNASIAEFQNLRWLRENLQTKPIRLFDDGPMVVDADDEVAYLMDNSK